MGISLTNTTLVNGYKLEKYGPCQWCRVLEVATIAKTAETKKKKILQNPTQGPFKKTNLVQAKDEGARLPYVSLKN